MAADSVDMARGVELAGDRLRGLVRETPVEPSPRLGEEAGCEVVLKLENLQLTGSFKLRGALNKLLSLSSGERGRGVVAASSGNHGAAVAFGAGMLNVRCEVFVPEGASPVKVRSIEGYGAKVSFRGGDSGVTEALARKFAEEEGKTYVSPYNDPAVVLGQGTIGAEMSRQIEAIDTVLVSVGGGGMISGVSGYLKGIREGVEVLGCSPENSPVMARSCAAGGILDMESLPTLSDGTAGGVERDAITFDLCRKYVDDFILVSEAEISAAMRFLIEAHHTLVEGAAALGVAALLKEKERLRGRKVAIVLCGANISAETLKKVL